MLWKTMTVIKHQHPFDVNWQAAVSSQAVLLTKVSPGAPHPLLVPQFFLSLSSCFIYVFLFLSSPTAQYTANL